MDLLNLLIGVHILLFIASWGYAELLDRIHDIYSPDYIWVTVVGGVALIIAAVGGVCAIGLLPWQAMLFAATLSIASGLPIIRWQVRLARKRAEVRARDKERNRP